MLLGCKRGVFVTFPLRNDFRNFLLTYSWLTTHSVSLELQVHNIIDVESRDQSRYVASQWDMSLQYNDISHWLGAYLDWSLRKHCNCVSISLNVYTNMVYDNIILHRVGQWQAQDTDQILNSQNAPCFALVGEIWSRNLWIFLRKLCHFEAQVYYMDTPQQLIGDLPETQFEGHNITKPFELHILGF